MGEGATARVVVADDHPIFRSNVARIVDAHAQLEVIGEAGNGRQALELISELGPDVAVLDVRMPELDGVEVVRAVQAQRLATRALLMSASVDAGLVRAALTAGAAGYLSKEADAQALCDAVLAVARGETALAPELQAAVLALLRGGDLGTEEVGPSPRELEVLRLVAQGASNRDIARELLLSTGTVKTYLQRLNDKLGTTDRSEAAVEAMRRGWLQ